MRIFRERPGVISEGPCWVCVAPGYLYTADTLPGLLWVLAWEWGEDRHLAG